MAGKVLEYELVYRENGEEKKDKIKISFVSNYCIREFNEISNTILKVTEKWDKYQDVKVLMAAKLAGGDIEESLDNLEADMEGIIKDITELSDDSFFNKRFNLLKVILTDNGLTESKFTDFDFWDRNVEPPVMLEFLESCIFKDIDKKKAQ